MKLEKGGISLSSRDSGGSLLESPESAEEHHFDHTPHLFSLAMFNPNRKAVGKSIFGKP